MEEKVTLKVKRLSFWELLVHIKINRNKRNYFRIKKKLLAVKEEARPRMTDLASLVQGQDKVTDHTKITFLAPNKKIRGDLALYLLLN